MEVPAHLTQPLCVDTNITYSLDLSKFPGLDDPEHKYQPALLIAQPSEVIPSPTTDTQNAALTAVTDWKNSVLEERLTGTNRNTTCIVVPPQDRHSYHRSHPAPDELLTARTTQPCFNSHQVPSKNQQGNNLIAKYALQAIFQNLIYPDVNRNGSFSLDTLVQSAASEPTTYSMCDRLQSQKGDNSRSTLNTTYTGLQRAGKRKRSCGQSCDNDTLKRLRSEMMSRDTGLNCSSLPYSGPYQGRPLVHRRVRELVCHM